MIRDRIVAAQAYRESHRPAKSLFREGLALIFNQNVPYDSGKHLIERAASEYNYADAVLIVPLLGESAQDFIALLENAISDSEPKPSPTLLHLAAKAEEVYMCRFEESRFVRAAEAGSGEACYDVVLSALGNVQKSTKFLNMGQKLKNAECIYELAEQKLRRAAIVNRDSILESVLEAASLGSIRASRRASQLLSSRGNEHLVAALKLSAAGMMHFEPLSKEFEMVLQKLPRDISVECGQIVPDISTRQWKRLKPDVRQFLEDCFELYDEFCNRAAGEIYTAGIVLIRFGVPLDIRDVILRNLIWACRFEPAEE